VLCLFITVESRFYVQEATNKKQTNKQNSRYLNYRTAGWGSPRWSWGCRLLRRCVRQLEIRYILPDHTCWLVVAALTCYQIPPGAVDCGCSK
jgi:hypothetical protein